MMKKLGACILGAALMAGVLAGCGGSSAPATTAAPAQTTAAAAETKAAEAAPAGEAKWPTGAVTILVGFGAGGSSDLGVRSLATYLEKATGGTFVVQNVTGANGWMAWRML